MPYKFNPFTGTFDDSTTGPQGPAGVVEAANSGTALLPGITFATDPNTGIYSPGADQLAISTNGTGRLFVNSTGLVGLGTSTPATLLEVRGLSTAYTGGTTPVALRISDNGTDVGAATWSTTTDFTQLQFFSSDASTPGGANVRYSVGAVMETNTGTSSALTFRSYSAGNPTERMRIDVSGRVGIGTTSPATTLDCAGEIRSYTNTTDAVITLGSNNNAKITSNSTDLRIWTRDARAIMFVVNDAERGRFDTSGRLLVGTSTARSNVYLATGATTPAVQFETAVQTYNNGLSLINYSLNGYSPVLTLGLSASNTQGTNAAITSSHEMGIINFVGNDGTNFRTGASIVATNDQAGAWAVGDCPTRLVFSTTADGSASPTERMRINNAGQILVGATSAPSQVTTCLSGGVALSSSTARNKITFLRDYGVQDGNLKVLQITIPASPAFLFIKMCYTITRASSSAVGASVVGEHYFAVARNGSGNNVVLDLDPGSKSWHATTTTAGGAANHINGNPNVRWQRQGAEANTDPQVVEILVDNRSGNGSSMLGTYTFEIIGTVGITGLVYI